MHRSLVLISVDRLSGVVGVWGWVGQACTYLRNVGLSHSVIDRLNAWYGVVCLDRLLSHTFGMVYLSFLLSVCLQLCMCHFSQFDHIYLSSVACKTSSSNMAQRCSEFVATPPMGPCTMDSHASHWHAMMVGLIEFGNCLIMPDGVSLSPAMKVHTHTHSADMCSVKTTHDGMVQKKGFTNMAQAFALAEAMYTDAGRSGAQSALPLITDGKTLIPVPDKRACPTVG